MTSYYKILEIDEKSGIDEIKHAYRKLCKLYHPDINKKPGAHEKFIEINEAYEVLMHQATYTNFSSENNEQFDYEEFIREVREAANRQARMRYEKFQHEHEAFRESGLYDAVLLLKYLGRLLVPFFALCLISIPIMVAVNQKSILPVFYLFFFWLIGCVLLFDAFQKRKNYFSLGKFYYSLNKILDIYKTTQNTKDNCFYCEGLKANSKSYKLTMIRMKGVQLVNSGPLQHHAKFDRKEYTIDIPRSQKAFVIHSFVSCIKVLTIISAAFILPFHSYVWRFIVGILLSWVLSSVFLWITHTRSKTGYFVSYGIIIKVFVWLGAITLFSNFDFVRFDVFTNDYFKVFIVIMLFLDSFMEQILNASKRVHLFKPLSKHYNELAIYFEKNCRFYLEIPVWTTIYPIIRWIF
jgi:hypothetical protein